MEGVVSFFQYFWDIRETVTAMAAQHAWMSLFGVFLGTFTAVPMGIFVSRNKRVSGYAIDLAGMLYTIPSLAILGFFLPFLGLGWMPTIAALVIYSWLPILRNTVTGIVGVDASIKEAARGMGTTSFQMLVRVELPLAMPVIMAAIRTVTVLTVGITTMGALVGAGGMGDLIFQGISMMDNNLILAGTIPVATMALLFDQLLGLLERRLKASAGIS